MIKKLFLDLNNFKANLGSVERGDSIELNIKLLDGEDYSRSKFRVLGAKADGKYVEQIEGINLEEKDLKIVLEDQFVNCEGIVKLELNVVSSETEITTKEFYFFVSNTMNAEIIDSVDSIKTLEKVSKYVDDAVNNLDALKEASEDITIINSEFKENEIKRKANEMLREKNEKARLQSEDIRITEEEEREANELERIKAENNRKASENNRKVSENTRVTNERAREEAELSRQSTFEENEEIRNENENLRIASEKERIKFNSEAKTDELNRKEAEKNRVLAEEERKSSEESRVAAEAIRQNTYTDFNESEEERKNNEIKRQEAEALRVEAETRRDNLFSEKEEERNTSFIESEKVRNAAFNKAQDSRNTTFEESETVREEAFKISEKARNDAEELRVTAESERVKSEKLRVGSEKARVLAEEERNTTFTQKEEERQGVFEEAENARKVAESKRVKAENSRIETEKLRVTAETGRVEAESLRVTAEEGRVAAETKREEGFNAFEGKINANTEELKNARSATTGEKFNTLDERIDCEVDRLNKKIDVTMLQQEDKENHTIENTVEGMTTDMVVKGKTLVNIVKSNRRICKKGASAYFQLIYPKLKTGKYTVILNASELTKEGITMYDMISSVQYPYNLKTGLNIRKIDVREEGSTYAVIVGNDNVDGTQFMLESLMILEGDWTNKPLPQYFEGIKSFGQEEDKISILSSNKNLFNLNEIGKNFNYKEIENGFEISNTEDVTYPYANIKKYMFLKKGTYTFSYSGEGTGFVNVAIRSKVNSDSYSGDIKPNIPKTFTMDSDKEVVVTFYLQGNITTGTYKNKYTNIQLVEGSKSLNYEPYKCDKKDILLPFSDGLKSVGNVCDELVSNTKKAIERIQKDVFVGNEDWIIRDDIRLADVTVFRLNSATRNQYKTDGFLICNKFNRYANQYQNYEGIRLVGSEGYGVTIGISKSKLTTDDSMGFKNLLKKWNSEGNPLILYSEMTTPVEHDLPSDLEVNTYQDKTYVEFQNSISGTSSFKAPVNTVATIARLNRENRALEEENRSLRQDFESTTLTLTDSDLELVKQNVDMDFRLMEVEFALDIPQAILSSDIKFKNKKGEVKSMARTPYEMMKIVILSGDYDREDYMHKVGKYYERGRMTKEEHDELMSLMTADEVISK